MNHTNKKKKKKKKKEEEEEEGIFFSKNVSDTKSPTFRLGTAISSMDPTKEERNPAAPAAPEYSISPAEAAAAASVIKDGEKEDDKGTVASAGMQCISRDPDEGNPGNKNFILSASFSNLAIATDLESLNPKSLLRSSS
jgi:hypothetical protein